MNLKHLSWFIELAKNKHFTKTAQKLYMDQSTLSKGIRALEDDLGVSLIDRTANVFRLTSHGEVLYKLGGETLEKVEDSLNFLRDSTAYLPEVLSALASRLSSAPPSLPMSSLNSRRPIPPSAWMYWRLVQISSRKSWTPARLTSAS